MAVAVSDTKTRVPAPKQASRWRRVFHTLIAATGWAVFAYWWTIVVGRVSPHEVRFTVLFVLGSFVLCILVDRDNKSYRPMRPDAPTGPGSSRA